MSVKNVVKVMNFHALLRVDKARKKAAMYFKTEDELFKLVNKIMFNHNIILDKKGIIPDKDKPKLSIYIGNDLGFCGDFNSQINRRVKADTNDIIAIGNKILLSSDNKVVLRQSKEDFFKDFKKVEQFIYDAIRNLAYSEIYIFYNRYYNMEEQKFTEEKIFPLDYKKDENETYSEDFATETEITSMLQNLISLYICYMIKICEMNSYAAENVVRQQLTKESLRKIDELEEEKNRKARKEKKQRDFQKIIENYRKG